MKLYSNLYNEIRCYEYKTNKPLVPNILYYSMFLIRRLLFVAFPTFLYNFSVLPLQLLMLTQTFYVIYYQGIRPHSSTTRVRLEIFNEIMVMVALYHIICFSEFNMDVQMQYYSGYSYICVFGSVFVVNLVPMFTDAVRKY